MAVQDRQAFAERIRRTLDFAGRQLRHLVTAHPDFFPMYTRDGKWKHSGEAWTNWCEGFPRRAALADVRLYWRRLVAR